MNRTKIAWTDETWNPITGCTRYSQACRWCYAEKQAYKCRDWNVGKYANGFAVTLHPELLEEPQKQKKSHRIFVNSMSDTFHDEVPDEFILKMFGTMKKCPQHTFQVLSKRSERLGILGQSLPWGNNIWAGVTVESPKYKYRMDDLRKVPAIVRFISLEPLLGELGTLDLSGIHWVIIGGLSGVSNTKMQKELPDLNQRRFNAWVRSIIVQAKDQGVAVFYKQGFGFQPEKLPLFRGEQLIEYP